MEFPITDLLDKESCTQWVVEQFHPNGFGCPLCRAGLDHSREFHTTKRSQLIVYRCQCCQRTYNLYTGTVFQQHHLTPIQVVLLIRGILKGEPSKTLAAELNLNYQTVLTLRHDLQVNAEQEQPETPLLDKKTEPDEMFQNAGEKGWEHFDPADPPRRRANKRWGRGTYENDRPAIVGTVGRESGQVRLRVVEDTRGETLLAHVHRFTVAVAQVYTDENQSYNSSACHCLSWEQRMGA